MAFQSKSKGATALGNMSGADGPTPPSDALTSQMPSNIYSGAKYGIPPPIAPILFGTGQPGYFSSNASYVGTTRMIQPNNSNAFPAGGAPGGGASQDKPTRARIRINKAGLSYMNNPSSAVAAYQARSSQSAGVQAGGVGTTACSKCAGHKMSAKKAGRQGGKKKAMCSCTRKASGALGRKSRKGFRGIHYSLPSATLASRKNTRPYAPMPLGGGTLVRMPKA